MYRIIYISENNEYQTFDADTIRRSEEKKQELIQQQINVICIVSYELSSYLYQSDNFEFHRNYIDDLVFGCEYYSKRTNLNEAEVKHRN